MASLVEVTTQKPKVTEMTLKLSAGEARDLQIFITDWYARNFGGSSNRGKTNTVFLAIQKALDGNYDQSMVKVATPVF